MKFQELSNLCEAPMNEDWKSKVASGLLAGASLLNMPNVEAGDKVPKKPDTETVDKKFEPNLIARIIFAEAGGSGHTGKKVSDEERRLVASTIYNRIGHKAFGNPKTAEEVVKMPRQYSALFSDENSLWKLSADPQRLPKVVRPAWLKSAKLANELESDTGKFVKDVVVYHDKSIKKPRDWTKNPYWLYVPVKTTPNFIFYKIVKK